MKKPARFSKLGTPIALTKHELPVLEQLYPYDIRSYTDLNKTARAFLADRFSIWKPYMEVVAISNHNGLGRQWGIIVFHYPNSNKWEVVAEFGHRPGGLRLRIAFIRWLSQFFGHPGGNFKNPQELGTLVAAR